MEFKNKYLVIPRKWLDELKNSDDSELKKLYGQFMDYYGKIVQTHLPKRYIVVNQDEFYCEDVIKIVGQGEKEKETHFYKKLKEVYECHEAWETGVTRNEYTHRLFQLIAYANLDQRNELLKIYPEYVGVYIWSKSEFKHPSYKIFNNFYRWYKIQYKTQLDGKEFSDEGVNI